MASQNANIYEFEKDIILVPVPDNYIVSCSKGEGISIYSANNQFYKDVLLEQFSDEYSYYGTLSSLIGDSVKELVKEVKVRTKSGKIKTKYYNKKHDIYVDSPLEAFIETLNTYVHFKNPHPYPSIYDPRSKTGMFEIGEELDDAERKFKSAQEFTYPFMNTLLIVRK